MRLWSLHPEHLDAKGIVALWREALLAQHVLLGKTKGYTHHPQLARFRAHDNPEAAIGFYLLEIQKEAKRRGYRFDRAKIVCRSGEISAIEVSEGQLAYEWDHLKRKLQVRDKKAYATLEGGFAPRTHRLFILTPGPIADWERV